MSILSVALAASCASTQGQQKAEERPTGAEERPLQAFEIDWDGHDRLDERVVPQHYKLHVEMDPSTDRFSGSVAPIFFGAARVSPGSAALRLGLRDHGRGRSPLKPRKSAAGAALIPARASTTLLGRHDASPTRKDR